MTDRTIPLRLADAVRAAFPAGGMTVAGLRRERDAGRLAVTRIAGKEFVTLAAIGHHHAEGYHREVVKVPLPPAGKRRERWLTRSEIARLVWAAWTMRSEQRREYGNAEAPRLPTRKRTGRHIARAILAERERCAKVAETFSGMQHAAHDMATGIFPQRSHPKDAIAAAIRRGDAP